MKDISVLMLDNNERFLKIVKEYLSEQSFIRDIYTTPNDAEAARILEEKKPHLILLDVLMPGKNGIDLIPVFREKSPESKIIMLTLWDMDGYRDSAKNAGADGFVSKRSMTETLLPAIEKVVQN